MENLTVSLNRTFVTDKNTTCDQTLELASSTLFLTILSLEAVAGPIGIVANSLILVSLFRTSVFHNNFRLLLGHMSLVAVGYCASAAVRALHALATLRTDPCQLVVSMYSCKLQELAVVLPLNNVMYSVLSIGIERLYATVRRHDYEHARSVFLSVFLLCVSWTVALGMQLSSIPNMSATLLAPFCVNILVVTKSAALLNLLFNISQECVGLIAYWCTNLLNKRFYLDLLINKASGHNLTGRFQMAQNMQISENLVHMHVLRLFQ